jgi:Rod binding domain-containing protein
MDVLPLQPHVNAADLPIEQLAANPSVSDHDKVTESCRQFEAVLLRQILGEARKTVIADGESDSNITSIYNDMVTKQLADSISRSGAFGLAKSLESQLVRQVLPPAQTINSSASGPGPGPVKAPNPHSS